MKLKIISIHMHAYICMYVHTCPTQRIEANLIRISITDYCDTILQMYISGKFVFVSNGKTKLFHPHC